MGIFGRAHGSLPLSFVDCSGCNYGSNRVKNVSTTTNAKVSVGSSSTEILPANPDRIGCVIVNDSDEVIYLNLSATAVMNEGIRLNASGGKYEEQNYTGAISGICSSGSKNVTVVEK